MKGVFFSEGLSFEGGINAGIENKVNQQIKCLRSIGELEVINVKFIKGLKEKIKFLLPIIKSDRERQREVLVEKVDGNVDYIYIRKPSLTIEFYKILREIKKLYPKVFIIMEIPTYPFHSEYSGISKLNALKSMHCEGKLKKVVDRIVTYSDDDEIWKIPTIKMSNCVAYDEIPPRSKKYKLQKKTIRLTCVANFMYWHGLDRLINGMKRYNGEYKIILNVVGSGREIDNLKKMADGMDNVAFHGPKTGEELTKIFDETDIAVDALGRHRSGVYYNSSLKGKEYVARGIPVISAVRTELDDMKDFPYYLRLPADESLIDIELVIDFYNEVYSGGSTDVITRKVRGCTEKYFDYGFGFKKRINKVLIGRFVTKSGLRK